MFYCFFSNYSTSLRIRSISSPVTHLTAATRCSTLQLQAMHSRLSLGIRSQALAGAQRRLLHSRSPLASARSLSAASAPRSALSFAKSSDAIRSSASALPRASPARTFASSALQHIAPTTPQLERKGSKSGGKPNPVENGEEATEDSAVERKDDKPSKPDGSKKPVSVEGSRSNASTPPARSSAAATGGASDDGGDSKPAALTDTPPSTSVSKRSVPEFYPQVLALPITRRPLFPGFYKAVVIRNPAVVAAIKEMMKRGQPYIGAFLLKDENADSDMYVLPLSLRFVYSH